MIHFLPAGIKIFLIISHLSWWWPVTDSSVSGLDLVTVLLFGAVAPAEVLTTQNAGNFVLFIMIYSFLVNPKPLPY